MIHVYVPSLLSESDSTVIVWVEVYRTCDELAASVVADEHRGAGFRVRVARS